MVGVWDSDPTGVGLYARITKRKSSRPLRDAAGGGFPPPPPPVPRTSSFFIDSTVRARVPHATKRRAPGPLND